ncbi:MAG: GNAT family N-acetyltransferase [Hyphomicrobiales bacterium]
MISATNDTLLDDIVIRRVWPAEFAALRAHLKRLDPESRQMRFGGAVSDRFIDEYVDSAHRLGTVVYGAFHGDDLVAAGELRAIFDAWPLAAEAAFSVEKAWQDHGLGDTLMGRIITVAQNRGIATVYMICMRENARMQHLAGKHKARLKVEEGDVAGQLAPAWPTPSSLMEEFFDQANGFVTAVLSWPSREPAHRDGEAAEK